ncbi:NAD(P)-binding domain-containing protein [Filimonas zeae]|uniref:NAD(P)-binding domain-containing protein n=1 Tax=Filimonas zeae TaxID=1737353 RepID=UPI003570F258
MQQIRRSGSTAGISEAIKEADFIVMAVWFDNIKELLKEYSKQLEGKTIIAQSNPIAPDDKDGFKKIIDSTSSSRQILSSLLRVVQYS